MILGCSQIVILLHTSPTYTVSTLINRITCNIVISVSLQVFVGSSSSSSSSSYYYYYYYYYYYGGGG